MREIAQGKCKLRLTAVACLLLAGGDGSRLGFDKPKGLFDPSIKGVRSIFELLTLRIKKISDLCKERYPEYPDLGRERIVLTIMTNLENFEIITEFFKENDNFGYSTVIFFPQSQLPVVDKEGRIMLKSRTQILQSPNGNGAIFQYSPLIKGQSTAQHVSPN